MNEDRFVVFVRSGDVPWHAHAALADIGLAIHEATHVVTTRRDDHEEYAVVMEVSGVDAVPLFTYRYGAKK